MPLESSLHPFQSRLRSLPLLTLLLVATLLCGCAWSGTSASAGAFPGGVSGELNGLAHGGRQPISGANVYAFAAGNTGYGSAAELLATTTTSTNGTGTFNFTGASAITCPGTSNSTYSNTLYLVIAGGQPTPGVTNADSVLLAVLGDCTTAVTTKPFIVVNEVTTFASMTAMQQFYNPSTVTGSLAAGTAENFGTTAANITGLENAASTVANLVDLTYGQTGATTATLGASSASGTSANGQQVTVTPESSKINLAANVLATCVNSNPGNSSICSALFSNVASASIADTMQAAYYMASNPTDTVSGTSNIEAVANSAVAAAPFSPAMAVSTTSYPNDWTIAVQYSSSTYTAVGSSGKAYFLSNPQSLAVDRLGDVWILNDFSSTSGVVGNSASQISPVGVPLQTSFIGANGTTLTGPDNIVIDPSNSVYVSNYGSSANGTTVIEYPYCASPCTSPSAMKTFNTGAGPGPMAIDGAGNIFVSAATAGAGDLEEIAKGSASGTTATVYANGLTASSLSSMAVDTSFNVYLASGSPSNPEIYIFPYGSYSSVNTFTGSAVGYPVAMGLDQVNDIFFGNYAANNLSEIQEGSDIGNTANGGTFSGGGLNKPHKLVLDGSSDIWTTNTVTSGSGVVSEFASADTPSYTAQSVISPVGGYGSVTGTVLTARNYNESYGIALDASGNVWVGAGTGSTITEIVGAATPVITPIASNLPATANAVTNVPVPTSTVYFGAWANPTAGNTGPALVESYTSTLESQVGRTFATHMHYYGWGTDGSTVASATPAFPDQAEIDDAAAGRIPVITWACSDLNSVVAAASSTVNTSTFNLIVATALAVKAFAKPMFIRWNWEMNLTSGNKCMGSGTSTQQQQNYINAWQNIYNIFKAQGVTNVSWLWNPGGAVADPDAAPFYPGNAYVDWIGFDGYDKVNAHDFGGVFNHFYQEYENSTYGNKPILIAETGECPTLQQLWLSTAVAEIAGRANTGNYDFSMVKGFMYFDAPGQYGGCVWNFDSEGITGFAVMGADPYFDAP